MFFISLGNYTIDNDSKILESSFILIKKIINLKYLKIKKIKNYFLNVKQIIFLSVLFKNWKFIHFKNVLLLFSFSNNIINSNIDGLLKLNIISSGLMKNNTLNLKNLFLNLKNLIWTNLGVFSYETFKKNIFNNIIYKNIIIESIDKIPFLTKYFLLKNIRISNTNRVRLGAYLSNFVTIMSEGYVNFNTFVGKNCMIEGRVSAGVYIGENCDLGGSSSIMGSLSGGGNIIVSLGKNILLGANSGVGISLGDNNIIEAGLYITSGTKIYIKLKNNFFYVKAKKLAFVNNLTFYRNSVSGKIECFKNNFFELKINKILHK